ncbi:MAG: DUF3048 domain-containing protein [Patescibacteria group bacterium]
MIAALLLVTVMVMAFFSTIDRVAPEAGVVEELAEFIAEQELRHPLTGERLDQPYETLPQVFGVMVENSADAWPLVGLDGAFLVIEAPVEGSIPRFIVFSSEESDIEKLGPVRSARPYYLDWNDELQGVYAHVGGSPEALDLIKYDYDTIDLNQFWQSEYFYRQNGNRYAPHNVYTSSELLISALDELELDPPTYSSWRFKDDSPIEDNARSLKVDFTSGATYDVDWDYNKETNTYTRHQGRSVMKMEDRATIEANNIIVLATDIRVIDNVGRKQIKTVGEGDALIAQDGEVFLCRWKKDERTDRLRFYTHDGFEISMNAGKTWIEVVDSLDQADPYDAE